MGDLILLSASITASFVIVSFILTSSTPATSTAYTTSLSVKKGWDFHKCLITLSSERRSHLRVKMLLLTLAIVLVICLIIESCWLCDRANYSWSLKDSRQRCSALYREAQGNLFNAEDPVDDDHFPPSPPYEEIELEPLGSPQFDPSIDIQLDVPRSF